MWLGTMQKNWNLFSVNVAMAATGLYQLSRKLRYTSALYEFLIALFILIQQSLLDLFGWALSSDHGIVVSFQLCLACSQDYMAVPDAPLKKSLTDAWTCLLL
jgi:hypothetical protein